jgi:hypothetical protein
MPKSSAPPKGTTIKTIINQSREGEFDLAFSVHSAIRNSHFEIRRQLGEFDKI